MAVHQPGVGRAAQSSLLLVGCIVLPLSIAVTPRQRSQTDDSMVHQTLKQSESSSSCGSAAVREDPPLPNHSGTQPADRSSIASTPETRALEFYVVA
jgi:hypothetical protein